MAQFGYTVAILKSQTMVLGGLPLADEGKYKPLEKIADEKILELLATSIEKKKKEK